MICVSKNGKDEFINAFAQGTGFPVVNDIEIDTPEPIRKDLETFGYNF